MLYTRQKYWFLPFDCNSLKCYITSSSKNFQILNLKKRDYIACMYKSCQWLAEVNIVQESEKE
ncbi:hypothetical protein PR048_012215, partial [Dryococelus australis]